MKDSLHSYQIKVFFGHLRDLELLGTSHSENHPSPKVKECVPVTVSHDR